MNKMKINVFASFLALSFAACDYLDVVPEGTSRLENAFSMRTTAYRYLTTCYSYLTSHDNGDAVDITGGDEVWLISDIMFPSLPLQGARYAEGLQTALSPLWNFWPRFYMALRDCNIFLENVGNVPDLPEWERDQWIAEAMVLKAYYHFLLLRQYGPVPIIRESLSISSSVDEVRVKRDKADDVADYAVELIDKALPALPDELYNESNEKGRITRPIALMIKAMIRVTIASPLFSDNGGLFASLHNYDDNTPLISSQYSSEKWALAVSACEEALAACDTIGMELYHYPGNPQYNLSQTILTQMSLRNAMNEKWNSELIWGDTKSRVDALQLLFAPKLRTEWMDYAPMRQYGGPPLKIAEMFYSSNGVPINEDKFWGYSTRYDLRTATTADNLRIRNGSVTARLHFDREARFYAWLGFDNGIWYGQGKYSDSNPNDLYYVQAKAGQPHNVMVQGGSSTGYYVKKWIHFQSVQTAELSYGPVWYVWPLFRLADLYLLYAESLNEAEDSEANRNLAISYLDRVRSRAGLQGVKTAWSNFSTRSNKYETQSGLREIIRQERMIELCFERKRFWDVRRWMTVADLYQIPIQGWNISQKDAADYYRPTTVFEQKFNTRDYFWPIPSSEITGNPNLVQNLGW
ncbi:MAG: RagB/SusD family nutrient uptake outer membrane protein [Bacteroidales bacterium]|nr:RagB/SusD family nutrient uptake outer membrane protein [Bacteroidales bacterium]